MAPVRVRLATPADLPAINDIYNTEVEGSTATWATVAVTQAERAAWFAQHPPGRYPVVVAEEGGTLAGWGSLSPFQSRGGWAPTVECSVYVGRDDRGRGIGPLLLDHLCRRGGELAHAVALALVSADNDASLRMCAREGFYEAGRLLGVGRKFERSLDCVVMQRFLRRRAGVVARDAGGRVLFIRRERAGQRWWILPGGGVEVGETAEQAAEREVREEAGLRVRLGGLGYRVFRRGCLQLYYLAEVVGAVPGGPDGPEYDPGKQAERGTYAPDWLGPAEMAARRCVPGPLCEALARGDPWPARPVTLYEPPAAP